MFFEPIYIPRALNTETCTQQGDLFYSAGLTGTGISHSQHWREKQEAAYYDCVAAADTNQRPRLRHTHMSMFSHRCKGPVLVPDAGK